MLSMECHDLSLIAMHDMFIVFSNATFNAVSKCLKFNWAKFFFCSRLKPTMSDIIDKVLAVLRVIEKERLEKEKESLAPILQFFRGSPPVDKELVPVLEFFRGKAD